MGWAVLSLVFLADSNERVGEEQRTQNRNALIISPPPPKHRAGRGVRSSQGRWRRQRAEWCYSSVMEGWGGVQPTPDQDTKKERGTNNSQGKGNKESWETKSKGGPLLPAVASHSSAIR